MRLAAAAVAAVSLALVGAGCRGAQAPGVPAGAGVAPRDTALFVSVDTDLRSSQWRLARRLLAGLPVEGKLRRAFDRFRHGVRGAVGSGLAVAALDLGPGADGLVGLVEPGDRAALEALLGRKAGRLAAGEVKGWVTLARDPAVLEAFAQARREGGLAGRRTFQTALRTLPRDALVKAFADGGALTAAARAHGGPAAVAFLPEVEWLAGALSVREDGVRVDLRADAELPFELRPYRPELPAALPGGAVLAVSFRGLDVLARQALAAAREAAPDVAGVLRPVELALGVSSLEDEVLPLLAGEGAIAFYPAEGVPTVVAALDVADAAGARRLADTLASYAGAAGATVRPAELAGVDAREVAFDSFSIFYAVFDGRLVVSNRADGLQGLRAAGPKLADDPVFRRTAEAAGLSGETLGFVYADLERGLPLLLELAERTGGEVPGDVRESLGPLRGALLHAGRDGDRYRATLFVGIE